MESSCIALVEIEQNIQIKTCVKGVLRYVENIISQIPRFNGKTV